MAFLSASTEPRNNPGAVDLPARRCAHCGNAVSGGLSSSSGSADPVFCCWGCRTVFEILREEGLDHYYTLKKTAPWIRRPRPAGSLEENFSYLDDPEFLENYSAEDKRTMEFYLEGVHCVACLWLVEKLPELLPSVKEARLDLGKSIARITLTPKGSFARTAEKLNRFGYRPHPIRKDEETEALQKKENRSSLIRLGVAGACTGNIMLMAFSLYGGAGGAMGELFRWAAFFLFLPVLFYCAKPFYRSAWGALMSKTLSIDVPIVLAILIGGTASIGSLLIGSPHLYFDSLSALVFLLLASRYVLRRIQQGVLSSSHLLHFLSPSLAKKKDPKTGAVTEVRAESLQKGERIEVPSGDTIPVDGIVRNGKSSVNQAVLTGESAPVTVKIGDPVFSGTVNLDAPLEVEVAAVGSETRLGRILQEIESGETKKAPIVTEADRLSRWFVWGVLALASTLLLIHLRSSFAEGLTRALALVIVTCPCALALATPLTLSASLNRAARQGLLIKGAETLERLSLVDSVVLDKTGTLTEGRFEVLQWMECADSAFSLGEAVLALESKSKHPIAQALVRHIQSQGIHRIPPVDDFREILGHGVSGRVRGDFFEIQAMPLASFPKKRSSFAVTRIGVWRNGKVMAQAVLGDRIRSDAARAIKEIKAMGLRPYLLSGDHPESVMHVGRTLEIPSSFCVDRVDPETKRSIIQSLPKALMVGDGANDALALQSAFVGAAVQGSMEVSLRAADVFLSSPGLTPVIQTLSVARETMKVIHRNLIFSLFYNLAGASAAWMGWMDPLFAAVLMPASSLTVFGSSLWGTRNLRALGKEIP